MGYRHHQRADSARETEIFFDAHLKLTGAFYVVVVNREALSGGS
jgi:hypothetical protein